jgi:hypothetical protein
MQYMMLVLAVQAASLSTAFSGVFPGVSPGTFPGPGYQQIGKLHDVTVYRRSETAFIDLAAEGVISAPPIKVREILLDYSHHQSFLPRMADVQVLEQQNGALLVYQRVDVPVIADRDMVLRITWGQNGDELWTRFISISGIGPPPRRGVVRVTNHEGGWQLVPLDGGRTTYARYRMLIDLGGSLPRWIARSHATKDVPAFFDIIRQRAQAQR